MLKTILIPASGTSADDSVFRTALKVGRPLTAHLDFYHVRLSGDEAAVRSPSVQFCPPAVLGPALEKLQQREDLLSSVAVQHIEDFCAAHDIAFRDRPSESPSMSARRIEEIDRQHSRFVFHARHRDLTILGRPHGHDQLRDNLITTILKKSGRPLVIAPDKAPAGELATIVVAWNESSAATRALAASLPLLEKARKVIILGIDDAQPILDELNEVVRYLEWHGIRAKAHRGTSKLRRDPTSVRILDAAAEMGADLLVAGGYSHLPFRETVFGGTTQSLIEHADLPVMLVR